MPKKNQTSWKKGKSGNSKGRPKTPANIKLIRQQLRDDIADASKILGYTEAQISSLEASSDKIALEGLIIQAIKKGDWKAIDSVLDRLLGKPRQQVTATDNQPDNVFTLQYNLG